MKWSEVKWKKKGGREVREKERERMFTCVRAWLLWWKRTRITWAEQEREREGQKRMITWPGFPFTVGITCDLIKNLVGDPMIMVYPPLSSSVASLRKARDWPFGLHVIYHNKTIRYSYIYGNHHYFLLSYKEYFLFNPSKFVWTSISSESSPLLD